MIFQKLQAKEAREVNSKNCKELSDQQNLIWFKKKLSCLQVSVDSASAKQLENMKPLGIP